VVGDVEEERGEDLLVGYVEALIGGVVEAEGAETVEFEVGCEVLGVAVPREEVQHRRAAGGRRRRRIGRTCPLRRRRGRQWLAAERVRRGEAEAVSGENGGRVTFAPGDPRE